MEGTDAQPPVVVQPAPPPPPTPNMSADYAPPVVEGSAVQLPAVVQLDPPPDMDVDDAQPPAVVPPHDPDVANLLRAIPARVLLRVEANGTIVMQPALEDVPAVEGVRFEERVGQDELYLTLDDPNPTLEGVRRAYNALLGAGVEFEVGGVRFGRMSGHDRFEWQGRELQRVREALLAQQPAAPESVSAKPEVCCICMDNKVNSLILPCKHQTCMLCMEKMLRGNTQHARLCALCRQPMSEVLYDYGAVVVSQQQQYGFYGGRDMDESDESDYDD